MIPITEYQARRLQLARSLPKDSIALIFAANEQIRNGDAHFRFRQDSNFYYLTGFNEPHSILVIDTNQLTSTIFNKPKNPEEEIWNGKILGQEGACRDLGFERAYMISEFKTHLPNMLANKKNICYDFSQLTNYEQHIYPALLELQKSIRAGISSPTNLIDIKPELSEMRLIKSASEINLLKEAAAISVQAHMHVGKMLKQLKTEADVETELLYKLHKLGCKNVAYEPIVASGNNACTLHYIDNNQKLEKNSLLLIDAGGEFANYAADITRVYPISGKFTPEQRKIYELVLKAQRNAIALVKPGCLWNSLQETIITTITAGLVELGILKGDIQELIANKAYVDFYMHGSGHWLGLDVHDCGAYKINNCWRDLKPGMVITVEPGIYIREGFKNIETRWQGIGIRIEDDILVTTNGYENLTAKLPTDIDAIEALCSE